MQVPTISLLGCGWLGLPLANKLIAEGYAVRGSTTTPEKIPLLAEAGIEPYLIKLKPLPDGDLDGLLQADILIVDIPPKAGLLGDEFHSEQIKAIIHGLQNTPVKWVIYISSTSVYPECNRLVVEEDRIADEGNVGDLGNHPLLAAERLIEQLSPERKTTILRCAGLMGYNRIPGKYVTGRTVDSGAVPVNYIHRDDAVEIIAAVIAAELTGVFNVVAPLHPTRKLVYQKSCADFGYTMPSFVDPAVAIPFKIVSGAKLAKALNYSFSYPDPLQFPY